MSPRLLFVILCVGLGPIWASAAGPKAVPKGGADSLGQCIADLGSDNYAAREAAMRQLEALGPAAQQGLAKALLHRDPEVRRRAGELAEKLAQRQEAGKVLEPSRLRLMYKRVPVSAALEDFIRVSGVNLMVEPSLSNKLAQRKITLDTGYTTFWDAFAQFCRAAGLAEKGPGSDNGEIHTSYSSGAMWRQQAVWVGGQVQFFCTSTEEDLPGAVPVGLALTEGKPAVLPTCQVGGVRLRALTTDPALNPWRVIQGEGEVLLGLEAMAEPNLVWQSVQSVRVEKAVDDRGQLLTQPEAFLNGNPAVANGQMYASTICFDGVGPTLPGGGGQRVPLRLRLGSRLATRLKEVQGTMAVHLLTAPQTIATLDRVLQSAGKSVKGSNGTVLSLKEVQSLPGGRWRLRVQISIPHMEGQPVFFGGWAPQWQFWGGGPPAEEDNSSPGNGGPLLLLDVNGHLVQRTEMENLDDGNGGMDGEIRLTFQPAPGQAEPARLVLQGRRSVLLDVPFHFHDVPLPK